MLVVHLDGVVQRKQDQQQSASTAFARLSSLAIVVFALFINMQEELHIMGKKRKKLNSIASKYLYCPTKLVLDQSRISLSCLRSPCCSFQCRISG